MDANCRHTDLAYYQWKAAHLEVLFFYHELFILLFIEHSLDFILFYLFFLFLSFLLLISIRIFLAWDFAHAAYHTVPIVLYLLKKIKIPIA